jgi:6-phosphofructokinase 1
MGAGAIEALKRGQRNAMIGYRMGDAVLVPFSEAIRTDKGLDHRFVEVLNELSI